MNCLCCGKPLRIPEETGWHKSCIKRFFGTTNLPEIEIDANIPLWLYCNLLPGGGYLNDICVFVFVNHLAHAL